MRYPKVVIVFLLSSLAGGCSVLQGSRLLTPERFELNPAASSILVEDGADDATKAKLVDAMKEAESAMRTTYGSVNSHPIMHACITERCYEAFGGGGSITNVYGDRIAALAARFSPFYLV